jgi:hypothetical protein
MDKTGFPIGKPVDMPLLNALFCHQKRDFKPAKRGDIENLMHDYRLLA